MGLWKQNKSLLNEKLAQDRNQEAKSENCGTE